jgi:hypothetical protein
MKITYTKENTHIEDSYQIKLRKSIQNEVEWIIVVRKARKDLVTRTVNSYVNEWKGHNRLYNLGLFKKHTKDVDLEENQKLIWKIIWFILGI